MIGDGFDGIVTTWSFGADEGTDDLAMITSDGYEGTVTTLVSVVGTKEDLTITGDNGSDDFAGSEIVAKTDLAIGLGGIETMLFAGTEAGTADFETTTNVCDGIVTTLLSVTGTSDPGMITGDFGNDVVFGNETVLMTDGEIGLC